MRPLRTLLLVVAAPALLSLAGCGLLQGPSNLTVTPSALYLSTSTNQQTVTLTNNSSAAVSWSASSSDSYVTAVPASGTLASGSSTSVTVSVSHYGLSQGQTVSPTVTFNSSAGDATLTVTYQMTIGGLQQCGTLPSTTAISSLGVHAQGAAAAAHLPVAHTADGRAYVPGEVLVTYNLGPAGQGLRALAAQQRRLGADVRARYGLQLLRAGAPGAPDLLHAAQAAAAVTQLRADPRVAAAQLNYYLQPQATVTPTDPDFNQEWTMQEFGLQQAWGIETGATNRTVIAIIDVGVQMNHPDLQAKIVGGCDFYYGDNDPSPGAGIDHGTHVAGIAAAIGDNGVGVAGVAWASNAKIEPIKIFDDSGQGATISMLVDAIRWAAGLPVTGTAVNPNPADVINMSLGVTGDQPVVDRAAQEAYAAGSLLVASAGNHGSGTPYATDPGIMSPANAPDVIAVGSVDSNDHISGFSNTDQSSSTTLALGTGVELMAPGGFEVSGSFTNSCPTSYYGVGAPAYGILSTYTGSKWGCDEGTSMASPFVAGIAALLKSHDPSLGPAQLRADLDAGVLYDSTTMTHSDYGYGIVCADKVLGASTTCGQ